MNLHERIRQIRTESHLTLIDLGKLLGVPDRTISNYERGERKPSVEYITLLAEKLNANPQWLILGTGQMFISTEEKESLNGLPQSMSPYDFKYVPMCELNAAAGDGCVVEGEEIIDYLAFKKDWLRKHISGSTNNIVIFVAKGDSMYPTIKDGDVLMIDTNEKHIKQEGIYVLRISDSLIVKRIQPIPGHKAEVISDNDNYKPYTIDFKTDQDVFIIGKVVWYGRYVGGM